MIYLIYNGCALREAFVVLFMQISARMRHMNVNEVACRCFQWKNQPSNFPYSSPPPDETDLKVDAMLRSANASAGSTSITASEAGASEYAQK